MLILGLNDVMIANNQATDSRYIQGDYSSPMQNMHISETNIYDSIGNNASYIEHMGENIAGAHTMAQVSPTANFNIANTNIHQAIDNNFESSVINNHIDHLAPNNIVEHQVHEVKTTTTIPNLVIHNNNSHEAGIHISQIASISNLANTNSQSHIDNHLLNHSHQAIENNMIKNYEQPMHNIMSHQAPQINAMTNVINHTLKDKNLIPILHRVISMPNLDFLSANNPNIIGINDEKCNFINKN